MCWQARKERHLGVKEAAMIWEETEGLGVEDGVRFFVHAVGDEKDRQARVEETVVHGICNPSVSMDMCRLRSLETYQDPAGWVRAMCTRRSSASALKASQRIERTPPARKMEPSKAYAKILRK